MPALAATRHIQRLRLRAQDETLAHRAARLLEDALRTASLPDAGARTFFFRRFALRPFSSEISPQNLSLMLERRIAALQAIAVHAAAPRAGSSAAVWFRDTLEAHTLLALCIAEGAPTSDWFWPLVVADIKAARTVPDRVHLVVESLRRYPEASRAVPLLAREMERHGHAHVLQAAVGAREAAMLLGSSTDAPESSEHSPQAASLAQHAKLSNRRPTTAFLQSPRDRTPQRANDIPAQRLTTTHARPDNPISPPAAEATDQQGQPNRSADPLVGNETFDIVTLNTAASGAKSSERIESEQPFAAQVVGRDATVSERPGKGQHLSIARSPDSRADKPRDVSALSQPPFSLLSPSATRPVPVVPESRAIGVEPAQPRWFDKVPTEAGGLLFLLPVLARTGFPQWLEQAPEWAPARIDLCMLACLCRRLNLPEEDPAWRLCATRVAVMPTRYRAPENWLAGIIDSHAAWHRHARRDGTRIHDATGRLLVAAWPGRRRPAAFDSLLRDRRIERLASRREPNDLAAAVAGAWLTACRRWLRRSAGIGLANLVNRSAHLSLTPTHADVFFDLSGMNLAVRRAGLDLDPGWVPWFGRVVSVHYGRAP